MWRELRAVQVALDADRPSAAVTDREWSVSGGTCCAQSASNFMAGDATSLHAMTWREVHQDFSREEVSSLPNDAL
jgi:hypothetical protein